MSENDIELRVCHLKAMLREHDLVTAIKLECFAMENQLSLLETAICYNAMIYTKEKANNKITTSDEIIASVQMGMKMAAVNQLDTMKYIYALAESLYGVYVSEQEKIMISNMTENKWGYV